MLHTKFFRFCVVALSVVVHTIFYASVDPSVIFVHLGHTIPGYLFDATAQVRKFNPEIRIIVIAEREAIKKVDHQLRADISFVMCEQLAESEEHKTFKRISSLDRTFREGFWLKTTERFFYLDEAIRQYELYDVFHLEYDNMLYVDLMELLPIFRQYENIASIFDTDTRCIPGFMYIAQPDSLRLLVKYIVAMAQQGRNDMEVIASFAHDHNIKEIDRLPVIMPEYIAEYGLRSLTKKTTMHPQWYMNRIEEFDSIFDGAAWGQFLGGFDPRNGHSRPGFVNETCLFNPSKIHFEWQIDHAGRRVPYAYMHEKKYRINNLHIHCKHLKAFAS